MKAPTQNLPPHPPVELQPQVLMENLKRHSLCSTKAEKVSAWAGTDDAAHPYNLPHLRKWLITIIVANGAACVAGTSSIYSSADADIQAQFGLNHEVSVLGLSLFLLGLGLGPLLLSPLSEFYGRRIVFIVSFTLFVALQIPTPLAMNAVMLLLPRFFTGLAGSAFLTVAGGTVSDMFSTEHLATPMSFYTASPFLGTIVGPLAGGFLCENAGWQWAFWVMLIWLVPISLPKLGDSNNFTSEVPDTDIHTTPTGPF